MLHRLLPLITLGILGLAQSAQATFHVMTISELMSGSGGDPDVQYVELRLESGSQNLVANTRLTAFNADGTVANVLLLTPSGVASGQNKRRILYATGAFTTATGLTPDFTIPPGIFTPAGMVCWGAPSDIFVPPPSWDASNPNNYIDCVAYGDYTGPRRDGTPPTNGSSGTPSSLPPGDGTNALVRVSGSFNIGSNATDFVLSAPGPCTNGAGGCGDVGCALPAGKCAVLGDGCPNGNVDAGEICDDGNTAGNDSCKPDCTLPLSESQKKCRLGILKAAGQYAKTYTQTIAKCEAAVLLQGASGPCPDSAGAEKISDAQDKLEQAIAKACATLSPAGLGYGATCPGFGNQCQAPIVGFSGVADCVACVHARFGDQLEDGLYGTFASGSPEITKCQGAIGKIINKLYLARYRLHAKCEAEVLAGKRPDEGPCASPYVDDFKLGIKYTGIANKAKDALCKACGGPDKLCDATGDLDPAAIGYASCPVVTDVTGCGALFIGSSLTSLSTCLQCLAGGNEPDCAQAVASRPSELPAQCNPTPAPTP